jgi:hypothetical protein
LDWGKSSDDSEYGERYVKRKEKMTIKGMSGKGLYFGEWSAKTHKPHGIGLFFLNHKIVMQHFKNGAEADGIFLTLMLDKSFAELGNQTKTPESIKTTSTFYFEDGRIE